MNKTFVGIIFIVAGVVYGSFAADAVYDRTLGLLVKYNWVKPPPAPGKDDLRTVFGRKPTILFYASILIIIGAFILWNRNN